MCAVESCLSSLNSSCDSVLYLMKITSSKQWLIHVFKHVLKFTNSRSNCWLKTQRIEQEALISESSQLLSSILPPWKNILMKLSILFFHYLYSRCLVVIVHWDTTPLTLASISRPLLSWPWGMVQHARDCFSSMLHSSSHSCGQTIPRFTVLSLIVSVQLLILHTLLRIY